MIHPRAPARADCGPDPRANHLPHEPRKADFPTDYALPETALQPTAARPKAPCRCRRSSLSDAWGLRSHGGVGSSSGKPVCSRQRHAVDAASAGSRDTPSARNPLIIGAQHESGVDCLWIGRFVHARPVGRYDVATRSVELCQTNEVECHDTRRNVSTARLPLNQSRGSRVQLARAVLLSRHIPGGLACLRYARSCSSG
jgi:hypothetical protein